MFALGCHARRPRPPTKPSDNSPNAANARGESSKLAVFALLAPIQLSLYTCIQIARLRRCALSIANLLSPSDSRGGPM